MKNLLYALAVVSLALMPALSYAQQPANSFNSTPPSNSFNSTPPANQFNTSCGVDSKGNFKLCNPLGITNFCDLVKKLLNIVMAIGVPVAVLFLVWAGFRFILARGSQQGLQDAKRNFMYVIIGIAVFLGAWTFATIISATIQTLDSSGTIQFCGR